MIPKFAEQIAAGGPVTVTHPEITRYFMSIREAAQLVLQAGLMGHGGEIFVLDMGVGAHRRSGPGHDPPPAIPNRTSASSGLRPGEKLKSCRRLRAHPPPPTTPSCASPAEPATDGWLDVLLAWLRQRAGGRRAEVRAARCATAPEYRPSPARCPQKGGRHRPESLNHGNLRDRRYPGVFHPTHGSSSRVAFDPPTTVCVAGGRPRQPGAGFAAYPALRPRPGGPAAVTVLGNHDLTR